MELARSPVMPRLAASNASASSSRSPLPADPAELHRLMAVQNAAASIAGSDYAIWEDACRRLLPSTRPDAFVPPAPRQPPTVLIIEASTGLRETMTRLLDALGYAVVVATGAPEGLSLAGQRKADLILTDVDIPAMDGITLLAQLRELPAHRSTPIMVLMAPTQEGKKIAARRAGANGWIGKPFDQERFLAIVQKVCPAP